MIGPETVPAPKAPRSRKPSNRVTYDKLHKKLAPLVLKRSPICQQCQNAFSVQAHHLRYPAESMNDYIAVCLPCHRKIHNG